MLNTNNPISNHLYNEHQAAAWLQVSLSTVRRWRKNGTGPRFFRFGALIRYRLEDLQKFVDTNLNLPEVA